MPCPRTAQITACPSVSSLCCNLPSYLQPPSASLSSATGIEYLMHCWAAAPSKLWWFEEHGWRYSLLWGVSVVVPPVVCGWSPACSWHWLEVLQPVYRCRMPHFTEKRACGFVAENLFCTDVACLTLLRSVPAVSSLRHADSASFHHTLSL